MKKVVIFLTVALALAGIGFVVFYQYRGHSLPPIVTEIVKNTSLRLNDCMRYQVQPSNTTYGELIEKLQKNVTEIDSKVIDLESVQTETNAARLKPLLSYLRASLDVLRAQAMVVRKQLACTSAVERNNEAQREYATSSSTSSEYASRAFERAGDELRKAVHEFKQAEQAMKTSLDSLLTSRNAALDVLPPPVLCDPQLIGELQEKAESDLKSVRSDVTPGTAPSTPPSGQAGSSSEVDFDESIFAFTKSPEQQVAKVLKGGSTGAKVLLSQPENGNKGAVKITIGDKTWTHDVATHLGQDTPLDGSALVMRIEGYWADFRIDNGKPTSVSDQPNNPAVVVTLRGRGVPAAPAASASR